MQEITSTTNDLIKETAKLQQKKYRIERKLFLLEGEKPLEEALSANIEIQNIFILKDKADKFRNLKDKAILVNDAVMKKIADTKSPPEILAAAKQVEYTPADFKDRNKLILLENIKDSGNLGTIIRTSAALGVEGIVLAGDCADIYNPKTVRSAAGNLFKLPIISVKNISDIKIVFQGYELISTVLDGEDIRKIKTPGKFILMFGSEASGLSEEAKGLAHLKAGILMTNSVESLNLAASAAIAIWELFGSPK